MDPYMNVKDGERISNNPVENHKFLKSRVLNVPELVHKSNEANASNVSNASNSTKIRKDRCFKIQKAKLFNYILQNKQMLLYKDENKWKKIAKVLNQYGVIKHYKEWIKTFKLTIKKLKHKTPLTGIEKQILDAVTEMEKYQGKQIGKYTDVCNIVPSLMSAEQRNILTNFISMNGEMVDFRDKLIQTHPNESVVMLWMKLSEKLNEYPIQRTCQEWYEIFKELAIRIMRKANSIKFGLTKGRLSEEDEKIFSVINIHKKMRKLKIPDIPSQIEYIEEGERSNEESNDDINTVNYIMLSPINDDSQTGFRTARSTRFQMNTLLDFTLQNKIMLREFLRKDSHPTLKALWLELTKKLNQCPPEKDCYEWSKSLRVILSKTKTKAKKIENGELNIDCLSALEQKALLVYGESSLNHKSYQEVITQIKEANSNDAQILRHLLEESTNKDNDDDNNIEKCILLSPYNDDSKVLEDDDEHIMTNDEHIMTNDEHIMTNDKHINNVPKQATSSIRVKNRKRINNKSETGTRAARCTKLQINTLLGFTLKNKIMLREFLWKESHPTLKALWLELTKKLNQYPPKKNCYEWSKSLHMILRKTVTKANKIENGELNINCLSAFELKALFALGQSSLNCKSYQQVITQIKAANPSHAQILRLLLEESESTNKENDDDSNIENYSYQQVITQNKGAENPSYAQILRQSLEKSECTNKENDDDSNIENYVRPSPDNDDSKVHEEDDDNIMTYEDHINNVPEQITSNNHIEDPLTVTVNNSCMDPLSSSPSRPPSEHEDYKYTIPLLLNENKTVDESDSSKVYLEGVNKIATSLDDLGDKMLEGMKRITTSIQSSFDGVSFALLEIAKALKNK